MLIAGLIRHKGKQLIRKYSKSLLNLSGELDKSSVGDVIEIKGWVKSMRNQKQNTFIDVSDGSTSKKLQVLVSKDIKPHNLTTGSSVIIKGSISSSPKGNPELIAEHINICGECVVTEGYPFAPRKEYSPEYVREYLHFRPRTNKFSGLLRIRSETTLAIHNYFSSEGYINIHTPIITSNDCEGAGEVFTVIPDNEKLLKSMARPELSTAEIYFGSKSYLTVSGQLHLEAAAHGLSKVYTFGPTFRAENSRSRLHLSEFYMLEAEIAFLNRLEELTSIIEKLIKRVTRSVLNKIGDEIDIFRNKENPLDFKWLDQPFPVMTYSEAVAVLNKHQDSFKEAFRETEGFSKEHEIFLVRYNGNVPTFVVNWPKSMKPFYMKECESDPLKVAALDLLAPDVGEIAGGSLREDNYTKLKDKLPDGHKLDWYLELRKFGGVPTGGYGLGFERYLQLLLGINNIKDTIPFPRWPHNCDL